MFDPIYDLPIELVAVLAAIIFVGFQWIGCVFIRPLLRGFVGRSGNVNAVVSMLLSGFGVLYGLLLSLLAVAGYQNLSEVKATAIDEASSLLALYRDVSEFPAPERETLERQLEAYCRSIIEEEWPILRKGEVPSGAAERLIEIRRGILDLDPSLRRYELVQAQALEHFEAMTGHGRERRYAAKVSIPTLMWYVVITGTLISYILGWLFEMRLTAHFFLGGLNAFFLGALILLIAVMDRPYRSSAYGVSPEPFELVYENMSSQAAVLEGER